MKAGCKNYPSPRNGIANTTLLRAEVECDEGYVLSGNKVTYCNGEEWITELGTCMMSNNTVDYSCDFEREDLCGWEAHNNEKKVWKRISAATNFHSNGTGPQRDHTFQSDTEGHFILMETDPWLSADKHFLSPIYPKDLTLGNSLCFQFHIFMFGTGVKNLTVSVKTESMTFSNMSSKFNLSGDHGAKWHTFSIPIDKMDQSFQVVFTVTDPNNPYGDIGIDDVKLMEGGCRHNSDQEVIESSKPPTTTTEYFQPPTMTTGTTKYFKPPTTLTTELSKQSTTTLWTVVLLVRERKRRECKSDYI
nr:MAM and LDL-receptor class A domain-containing protein 2-like [Drosophila takahashii]